MRHAEPSKAEAYLARWGRKRAEDYCDTIHDQPCQYGHLGCAAREGGACSDELSGLIVEVAA